MTPETQNDLLGMIWQKGEWNVALRQTQELKDLLDEAGLEACFHQLQALPERVARIKFHHREGLWALPEGGNIETDWVLVWEIDPLRFLTETEGQPTTV